jgi:lysyl-tRNA synthetase class 2
MDESSSSYEQERRQKLQKLRELGIDPYGGRTPGLAPLSSIRMQHRPEFAQDGGPVVAGAGRIMLLRNMGKLAFVRVRDDSGDLQVAVDKRRVDERSWEILNLLDLADQVVFEGKLGATKTGEVTVWATKIEIASKALLPPPAKWEGLTDVEARYRQRYVDLWANPEVMRIAKLRIQLIGEVRRFLAGRGFVEVETPMMQALAGGAAARPFVTHHNALDIPLFMRIAPELFLKRLLVGGMPRVFELNRNFRNEGISPRHNPEFTMLEAYEAYGNWETMANLVEEMICHLAANVINADKPEEQKLLIEHKDAQGNLRKTINLKRPWRRVRLVDLVEERTGWKFNKEPLSSEQMASLRSANPGKDLKFAGSPAEQLTEVYEKLIEPTLIDPCFVTQIPSVIIPLARECKDDPFFADVYELAVNGQEISPGYTELNDPDVQEKHFRHQVGDAAEQHKFDNDFVTALKFGMPPAGGMGMGIDRLIMMLTGAESIRDVILFPLMRPQEQG